MTDRSLKYTPYIGKKFGKLTLNGLTTVEGKGYFFTCDCECGKPVNKRAPGILRGAETSCGCDQKSRKIDFESQIGERTGSLVMTDVIRQKGKNTMIVYECDCGHTQTKSTPQLKQYPATCSKCFKYEAAFKSHGMARTPIHSIWKTMRQRCLNPKSADYKYYGARGITICERWDKFENFFEDMGHRPEGLSLDRTDNEKGYSKENCKWSNQVEQIANSRPRSRFAERDKIICKKCNQLSLKREKNSIPGDGICSDCYRGKKIK